MENDGGQLFEEDMSFIYEKEDLVTLRPGREYAWLDGVLERTLQVLRCRLIRVMCLPFLTLFSDPKRCVFIKNANIYIFSLTVLLLSQSQSLIPQSPTDSSSF